VGSYTVQESRGCGVQKFGGRGAICASRDWELWGFGLGLRDEGLE
jgi:hypothetical protein